MRFNLLKIAGVILATGLLATQTPAKTFDIDKEHTNVGFKIRHLLSHVSGRFIDFAGKFEIDDKSGKLQNIEATVKVASIDTDIKKRDDHLRSPDFFDAKKMPEMTFKSEK